MEEFDFKKQYDENEAFATDLFARVVQEKDNETERKKSDLYGQFVEEKDEEEKTYEKMPEIEPREAEPLMMDISSAVDEKTEKDEKKIKAIDIFKAVCGVLMLVLIFADGFLLGKYIERKKKNPAGVVDLNASGLDTSETEKLQAVYNLILENYYRDVDPDTLVEGAIKGMVASIEDPYGGYLVPGKMDEYEKYIDGKDENNERLATVKYSELENNIYCILIEQFTDGTAKEFKDALSDIAAKKCRGIIIDLRNNPGGTANDSIQIADMILPAGTTAICKDRTGKTVETNKSDKNEITVPVCLLVNENTASAAELVTGAFRDFKKGEIIGKHTYGKALAQISFSFQKDGSGLVISAFTYYTPSGECIDKKGIDPTIEIEDDPETEEDEQLLKAIEVINKNV